SAPVRRLGRTIDWLELAWRNADAIAQDLRIAALHSGFELLLDAPADTVSAAETLSALLDSPDAQRHVRPAWRSRKDKPIELPITDLGWWYVQFAQLRNAILHGDDLAATDYLDDQGRPHKWVAEETLRRAITETLARAGWPDLRIDRALRAITQAT